MAEMLVAGRAAHFDLLNLCVWVKSNGGMGSLYRSRHELVFVFRNGKEQHRNNVQLGRFGRNRTNAWNYAGAHSFPRKGRKRAIELHPTVKPIALVSDALLDVKKQNDIVIDPFCGIGATILAAERTGRRGYGVEIDPLYVDTTIARWAGRRAMRREKPSPSSRPTARRAEWTSAAKGDIGSAAWLLKLRAHAEKPRFIDRH
jgi:DNA modification methylase